MVIFKGQLINLKKATEKGVLKKKINQKLNLGKTEDRKTAREVVLDI